MARRVQVSAATMSEAGFGERLAALCDVAGPTHMEVAAEIGVSQRKAVVCGRPAATPPARKVETRA